MFQVNVTVIGIGWTPWELLDFLTALSESRETAQCYEKFEKVEARCSACEHRCAKF